MEAVDYIAGDYVSGDYVAGDHIAGDRLGLFEVVSVRRLSLRPQVWASCTPLSSTSGAR